MANFILDNTLIVQNQSAAPFSSWFSGARIQNVIFYVLDTTAAATFQIAAGTPILQFGLITHGAVSVGSAAAVVPTTYVIDMGGAQFRTAWIPTTLTACSAWINFA